MKRYSDIVTEIAAMQPDLDECAISAFERSGNLRFRDGDKIAVLQLTGIQFFGTNQSLLGWEPMNGDVGRSDVRLGRDCGVDYFDILEDSAFLSAFLNDELGFLGSVIPYDMSGKTQEKPGFRKPVHVSVVCAEGQLDVICEQVALRIE